VLPHLTAHLSPSQLILAAAPVFAGATIVSRTGASRHWGPVE
jgi:hypothetical protein